MGYWGSRNAGGSHRGGFGQNGTKSSDNQPWYEVIRTDRSAQERPLWNMTCYGYRREGENDVVGDISPEEVRYANMVSAEQGVSMQGLRDEFRTANRQRVELFQGLSRGKQAPSQMGRPVQGDLSCIRNLAWVGGGGGGGGVGFGTSGGFGEGQQQSGFGQAFGSNSAGGSGGGFGQAAAGGFGQAFGGTGGGGSGGGFGQAAAGGFGQAAAGGFGQQHQGGFGQQHQGGFGQQHRGGFGQQHQGGFGQQQSRQQQEMASTSGGFGQQQASGTGFGGGFGQQQHQGGFGQQQQQQQPAAAGGFGHRSGFGQPTAVDSFGQQGGFGHQGGFGQPATGALGQQPTAGGFGQTSTFGGGFGQQKQQQLPPQPDLPPLSEEETALWSGQAFDKGAIPTCPPPKQACV